MRAAWLVVGGIACGTPTNDATTNDAPVDTPVDAPPLVFGYSYVKADSPALGDGFGVVGIASDGATIAVGATGRDGGATDSGAVYILVPTVVGWTQQAYLTASNRDDFDTFGSAVALSANGDLLAVGAYNEDSATQTNPADNTAFNSGAVYIFVRTGTSWVQEAYLKPASAGSMDGFGYRVALSDDGATLVVGAPGEDGAATTVDGDQSSNAATDAGAAYVFTRSSGVWTQTAYLKAPNAEAGDAFGSRVAISRDGNTLVATADRESSDAVGVGGNPGNNNRLQSGAAYVFRRSGATWLGEAYVKASNASTGGWFGSSVALSGNGDVMLVGSIHESSAAPGVNGDQTNTSLNNAGAAYVFERANGVWAQTTYLKASNPGLVAWFSNEVALSADGKRCVVSSMFENSSATGINGNQTNQDAPGSGAAYLFDRGPSGWVQDAYVKATNTNRNDIFGSGLAIAGDGRTIVLGAIGEASASMTPGDNSMQNAGAVYVLAVSP